MDRSQHNEGREPIMRDVQQVLRALREGNRENPDVLAIEQHNVMLALNKGFPKHMYHETLDPVVAMDKQDEKGLKELGYVEHYIPREFPCWIFRRNFSPKFAISFKINTNGQQSWVPENPDQVEFVESRLVKNKAALDAIMREPKPPMPPGLEAPGPWVRKVTDIPAIAQGSEEESQLTEARLQGQIQALERQLEEKRKQKAN